MVRVIVTIINNLGHCGARLSESQTWKRVPSRSRRKIGVGAEPTEYSQGSPSLDLGGGESSLKSRLSPHSV